LKIGCIFFYVTATHCHEDCKDVQNSHAFEIDKESSIFMILQD
jgi:hypothetical protein